MKREMYTTDATVYINNVPIKVYSYNSTKPANYLFVYAEDLKRYGFDVMWEGNILTIKRIPGKQPDEITSDEYKLLTKRDKFGELISGFYQNDDIRLFIEGNEMFPDDNTGVISSRKGPLVSVNKLGRYYGTYTWDLYNNLYIGIDYDFATCRTKLTGKRFRTTEPLREYVMSKGYIEIDVPHAFYTTYSNESYKDEAKVYYFSKSEFLKLPEGNIRCVATYAELEVLENFGMKYEFTDNTLEIPFGQKVKKEDIGYLFRENLEGHDHQSPVEMSCVDLKLMSDGKEIGKEDVFPPIINRGGGLYIKLQSLAEIVKVDGKSEKLGILEESEIIRKETDLEILEEAKLDIVSEISKWNEVKKKVETKIVKPVVEGSVIFGVGVLCLKSEILSKG